MPDEPTPYYNTQDVSDDKSERYHKPAVSMRSIVENPSAYPQDSQEITVEILSERHQWDTLEELIKNSSILSTTIANQLIEADAFWLVIDNIDKFKDQDIQLIAEKIASRGGLQAVAHYIDEFKGLNQQKLIDGLLESGMHDSSIAQDLYYFTMVDQQAVLENLIQHRMGYAIALRIELYKNIDKLKIADLLIKSNQAQAVVSFLQKFENIDKQKLIADIIASKQTADLKGNLFRFDKIDKEVAYQLVDFGQEIEVLANIDRFEDLDRNLLADKIIMNGNADLLLDKLDVFPNVDRDLIFNDLYKKDEISLIILNISKFSNIDLQKFAIKAIEDDKAHAIAVNIEYLYGVELPLEIIQKKFESIYFDDILALYKELCREKWPEMDAAIDVFGDELNRKLFYTVRLLFAPVDNPFDNELNLEWNIEISANLREFGVNERGPEGLEQLKKLIKEFELKLINNKEDNKLLLNLSSNWISMVLLKKISRFEESQWGTSSNSKLRKMIDIQYSIAVYDGNRTNMSPSEAVEITMVEAKRKDNESMFDPNAEIRYQRLRAQLQAAAEMVDPDKNNLHPFSEKIAEIAEKIQANLVNEKGKNKLVEARSTYDRLVSQGKEMAAAKVAEQITKLEMLEGIQLRSLRDFEHNYLALAEFKNLHNDISILMFAWALRFPPGGRSRSNLENIVGNIQILPEDAGIDSMGYLIDQIDHVINQEVFGHFFQTEEAKNQFRDMTSTKMLQLALKNAQGNQRASGKVPIQFMPTRGMLMELSGHIADACWAERYDSIAEEFPNFTAVSIRQHPEGKHDKLVGAFLLIEADSGGAPGFPEQPLLIIRGLNPIQNFINKVDVEEFYLAATNYVKNLAKVMGKTAAIVIDDHSGGSGTNRPVLFGYLSAKRSELKKVRLKNNTDSEFNGYNIQHDTYLL